MVEARAAVGPRLTSRRRRCGIAPASFAVVQHAFQEPYKTCRAILLSQPTAEILTVSPTRRTQRQQVSQWHADRRISGLDQGSCALLVSYSCSFQSTSMAVGRSATASGWKTMVTIFKHLFRRFAWSRCCFSTRVNMPIAVGSM